ncbi:YidC/Oxa1 family membrane protein insertase [Clostridium sp. BJN0013]|uniref:YidC/Oxa1 family membrane protein insertase n=1 Tax=Clostridium sp. BJN0013 TaxID=3236840 RepID=UPI0034C69FA1
MFDFIAYPTGHILRFMYEVLSFKNYGIAIILLTVIIRTLLLPLYIKQYRSTSKISEIQPKIKKIQEKYKNDSEKLNQHMIELYKENNINPAEGCLPLLLQIPILFSLYYVVSQPLKYMFEINSSIIDKLFNTIPHNMITIKNMLNTSENKMQDSIQKNMLLLSPIMTGFISFQVPAGMGLYWIISNIYQIFQQMFMNKFIIKKEPNLNVKYNNKVKRRTFL